MIIDRKATLKVITDVSLNSFTDKVNLFIHSNEIISQSYTKADGEFTAFIDYVEEIKTPENIKDEYELSGEVYRCKDCPKWGTNYNGDPKDAFKCMARVTRKTLRGCNPACLFFYEKLARGEIRPYET